MSAWARHVHDSRDVPARADPVGPRALRSCQRRSAAPGWPGCMLQGMRTGGLVSALLLTAACAVQTPRGDDDDPTGGPDAGAEACTSAGATRCSGGEYQTCEAGSWQTSETCVTGETCYPGHGCAECSPTSVRECVGNDVHACTSGELGDVVEICGTRTCSRGSRGGTSTDCAEGTQVICAVATSSNLLAFDPRQIANSFRVIGRMNCPAGPPGL